MGKPSLLRRTINLRRPFYGGGWPAYFPPGSEAIVERKAYRGQKYLELACTQLDPPYKSADQKRILAEWNEFFRSPSQVRELGLFTRTPQELFEAICSNGLIQRLHIKWGPVKNLRPIEDLQDLDGLWLGTTGVTDLKPVARLPKLTHLALDNLRAVHDFAALGDATRLEFLYIQGYPQGPQKIRMRDLDFLCGLTNLRALCIDYVLIESFDVKPILGLKSLEYLSLPDLGRTEQQRLDEHAATIVESLPKLQYGRVIEHVK